MRRPQDLLVFCKSEGSLKIKADIWLSPMTKAFTSPEHNKKHSDNTKRHKNFDYTTIMDQLRTVSWSDDNHPTGVVKPASSEFSISK